MATTLWPLTLTPTSRCAIWTALTPDPTANSRLDYIIGLSTSTAFPPIRPDSSTRRPRMGRNDRGMRHLLDTSCGAAQRTYGTSLFLQ
ncbi:hypothetical protein BDZ89DRAFT_751564 [Hymenopellis radicata]|nr:hypothetical protein BDZ89DRAFT_751564 [Hymenopellis radicata]